MNMMEELKARDERIENLEMALLFLMSSRSSGSYHYKSAQEMLADVIPAPPRHEWVEKLLNELGSSKKVLEEYATICEERLKPKDR